MRDQATWDAASRYGRAGRAARRILKRALRPALVRQAAVDAELDAQIALQHDAIERLHELAARWARELGDLEYRIGALDRDREFDAARALLTAATLPREGEQVLAVAHDWHAGEEPRAPCSLAIGPYASLLQISAVTLEAYAERHRWNLMLSREDLAAGRHAQWGKLQLTRNLLQEYGILAWIDSDALIVDFEHDLGDELERRKDLYIVKQHGGLPREEVLNSGVFMLRAGDWTERLLDAIWAQADADHHGGPTMRRSCAFWATTSTLFPLRPGVDVPWLERVKVIDLAWNSIPHWSRSPHPRINHWGGRPLLDRRRLMLDDLIRTMVTRVSSDPSRASIPGRNCRCCSTDSASSAWAWRRTPGVLPGFYTAGLAPS